MKAVPIGFMIAIGFEISRLPTLFRLLVGLESLRFALSWSIVELQPFNSFLVFELLAFVSILGNQNENNFAGSILRD